MPKHLLLKASYSIAKWFSVVVVSLLCLYVILLCSLRFANPYLQSHNQQIEKWASDVIGHSMKIGKIEIDYFNFQPVITLDNVTILDALGKEQTFKLRKLSLGMDLVGSVVKRQPEAGLLVVEGAVLNIHQTQDGKVHLTAFDGVADGSGSAPQPASKIQVAQQNTVFNDKLLWLLNHGKIVFDDVNIAWQPSKGKAIEFNQVKLKFINGFIRNKIIAQANIVQDQMNSHASCSLRFNGNPLAGIPSRTVTGTINLSNFAVNMDDIFLPKSADENFLAKFLPKQGNISLHLSKLDFTWNKIWGKSQVFPKLDSKLTWNKSANDDWRVEIKDFRLSNDDLFAKGGVRLYLLPGKLSPICDLQFSFNTKALETFSKYFPDKAMPPGVVGWLNKAFESGEVLGTIILKGELSHFPFVDHEGTFLVNLDISDANFHYHSDWPMLQHFNGKVTVSGKAMHIVADSVETADIPVYHVTATIPDLGKAVLEVNSQAYLPGEKGLRFISLSPLKNNFGDGFKNVILHGAIRLGLKLIIPLSSKAGVVTQVLGAISLHKNTLILSDWDVQLEQLGGNLRFTEHTMESDSVKGTLFDDPVTLQVSTVQADEKSQYKVAFSGRVDMDDLQKHLDFPFSRYLQGVTDYDGVLTLSSAKANNPHNTFEVNSKLLGIEAYVAPLLKKSASEEKNFTASLSFASNSPRQDFLVNYNNEMSAALSFEKGSQKKRFSGGTLNLSDGDAKISKNKGLFINANFGKIDWLEWQKKLFSEYKAGEIKGIKDLISQINLKIAELRAFDHVFKAVQLSLSPDKKGWLVAVKNDDIAGNIFVPSDLTKDILSIKLQRAYLPANESKDSKNKKKVISPKEFPALDVLIDDFRYGDKVLGKFILKAESIATGLNLSQLEIHSENFQLEATGKWEQYKGITRSFLNGKCRSQNVGDAFKQLHFTESLKSGVGAANFALAWSGAFYDLDVPSLNGNMSLDVRNGRIVNLGSKTEAEMGIGRLLSILSLQTLSRRLTLDFSDLIKTGFSFDSLDGTFKLFNGDAFTQDMQLKGPVAQVAAKGRIGFAGKDFDMSLIVVPHLTSSLPVIASVLGTPVVGAGIWLADKVIGNQVTKAVASYVYQVKGPWADPSITK